MGWNKKDLHLGEAERLYVIDQLSLDSISERLGVTTRTLSTWKNEGEWERKRAEYLQSKQSFHEELYEFSRALLKKVRGDIEAGKDPSNGQLFTLTKLLVSMGKVKEYEDETTPTKTETSKDKKEEILQAIAEVLGV